MQPEDLANAFATFADKVDLMSDVVDRFNEKLSVFNEQPVEPVETTTRPNEEVVPVEDTVSVPPTAVVGETVEDTPNSVLSLIEALSAWKGE
mgnify:CR=1 FL=1